MKKFILAAVAAVITLGATLESSAQYKNTNIQLHYNWGNHMYKELRNQHDIFATIEHASIDKWGKNYGFVDMLMGQNGMRSAYTELSRELKFWDAPFSAHIEYNGGLSNYSAFNNVYLAGPSYSYVNAKKNLTLSAMALYRHDQKMEKPHNFQFTGVWSWTSWNRLWTLNGFVDLWTMDLKDRNHMVMLAQPQLWFNLNQVVGFSDYFNLSIGTEIQLSYNFVAPDKFYAQPTAAIKWTF